MFFRREKVRELSFSDRLEDCRRAGFTVETIAGGALLSRKAYACVVRDAGDKPVLEEPGLMVGKSIAKLVDAGYQKFFLTPEGAQVPALAEHLRALHNFDEDLREALGLISLYNMGLGSTCADHLYDRVKDRDHGVPKRPWQ